MPSYKRYKRRTYRPKKTYKSKSSWSGYARKGISVARQLWQLKGLVNSEMFKLDNTLGPADIPNSTGLVVNCQNLAVGDSDAGRTGNSIYARSYNMKGFLSRTTSGDPVQQVRIALVQDLQQIGDTGPSVTDIYESTNPFAHLQSAYVGRFKILWSRVYMLDVVKNLSAPIEVNVAMRHHIRFNGGAGSDIQKGGLWLICTSTQATANFPVLTGESRLSYHDN